MTEPSATNENKTSVVDDFFSALFANNSISSNETRNASNVNDGNLDSSRDATVTPIPTDSTETEMKMETPEPTEEPTVENEHHYHYYQQQQPQPQYQAYNQANEQQVKSEPVETTTSQPVLDEFDEYSLLSSRKQSDSTFNSNSRPRPNSAEQPARTLAKRHIDWDKVIPESRMLIHQLPKSTSKQELMDYFSKYGEVLEVVQKNTFGFVHFENPEQCARAVEAENYKTFKDVLLNLEICKRKPKFARSSENDNNQRRRNHGPRNNNRDDSVSPSRSRNRSPQPPLTRTNNNSNNKRRNSDTRNGREPKVMNDYRNRERENNYGNNGSVISSNSPMSNNRHENGAFDYERTNNYRPDYSRMNKEFSNSDHDTNDYGRENNYRPDYATARRNNNNANNNGKRVDPRFASGYNYNNSTSIISRNDDEVPAVQIISWNTDNGLMNYTENLFTQNYIHASATAFNYLNYSRDELVKQMVLEGVKALILIDGRNAQGKLYLQVFAPVDHGDGVRYDEYDSVTPNEAVSIVQNTHPELTRQSQAQAQAQPQQRYKKYTSQPQKRAQYKSNPPVAPAQTRREPYKKPNYSVAPQYSGPTYSRQHETQFDDANPYQQKSPYYNPTAFNYQYKSPPLQLPAQQPNYVTQSTFQQHPSLNTSPNIDANTLATIYTLIQSDTLSKMQSPAVSYPSQTQVQPTTSAAIPATNTATTTQPSIPQLLATLVNSLGSANTNNSNSTPPPPAPALLSTTNNSTATNVSVTSDPQQQQQQPSMAALLSTAAGGNPALAQLLLQMTSGVTNSSSPTPSNATINSQTSPLVSQTRQYQQDYGYSSYGHQRN